MESLYLDDMQYHYGASSNLILAGAMSNSLQNQIIVAEDRCLVLNPPMECLTSKVCNVDPQQSYQWPSSFHKTMNQKYDLTSPQCSDALNTTGWEEP